MPLKLCQTQSELQTGLSSRSESSRGLVPTMGNLHRGHLSLVESALQECDHLVVSIFVNPKQFGPQEDFARYPRTLEADLQQLKPLAHSQDLFVFAPHRTQEIFPADFATHIEVPSLSHTLCGRSRPGHFAGVATVVHRLFSLVRPARAYFGLKDYQQFLVIQKMVQDLLLQVELRGLPIQRDQSGLALSSRNQYLSPQEREEALILPQSLKELAQLLESGDWEQARSRREEILAQYPHFEYLEILRASDLAELTAPTPSLVVCGALRVGSTRLIDNQLLTFKL